MVMVMKPQAGCALGCCQALPPGRMGERQTPETAERNVERKKASTWISLLPLIGAENKTETQLERTEHVSHEGKELCARHRVL